MPFNRFYVRSNYPYFISYRGKYGCIFFAAGVPCIPVSVPHRFIGFLPVGPVIANESRQAPYVLPVVVLSVKSKKSKSSLSWQISEKE